MIVRNNPLDEVRSQILSGSEHAMPDGHKYLSRAIDIIDSLAVVGEEQFIETTGLVDVFSKIDTAGYIVLKVGGRK